MISMAAPMMYQEKTMNSSFILSSMLVNVRRQPQSRKPHYISTSRHVNQFSWTLKGSSTLSTAHLHQDQLVAGGGESEYLLIKLESWSVGDLVVAFGVSLFVLNTLISRGKSVEVTPELVEVNMTFQSTTETLITTEYLEESQRRHLTSGYATLQAWSVTYRDWTLMLVVESLSSSMPRAQLPENVLR